MTAKEKVIEDYLKLTPDEQRSVEEVILENREASAIQLSESQLKEVLSRREEMMKDPSKRIPWSEIQKDLRARQSHVS